MKIGFHAVFAFLRNVRCLKILARYVWNVTEYLCDKNKGYSLFNQEKIFGFEAIEADTSIFILFDTYRNIKKNTHPLAIFQVDFCLK